MRYVITKVVNSEYSTFTKRTPVTTAAPNVEAKQFPLCTPEEFQAFIHKLAVKPSKTGAVDSMEIEGVKVLVAIFPNSAGAKILDKIKNMYTDIKPSGYAAKGQSNYAWASYDFTDPKMGTMRLSVDKRKTVKTVIRAFNQKVPK